MNPITYDRILKARMLKASEESSMDEKNKYCQKHFGCNYSECTPKQKAQCNENCGKVSKGEDGPPKQIKDSSPDAVNILEMDEDGKKKKSGSLPDHSGDGKITQKDRLMAIGAIPKPNSDTKKSDDKAYKNMNCMNCDDGSCEQCYDHLKPKDTKKSFDLAFHTGWTIAKAQPCSARGCGAMPGDGPENCNAGENPALCTRRKAAARQSNKQMRRQKGKVRHLDMADEGY